jgi:hypothetical protein
MNEQPPVTTVNIRANCFFKTKIINDAYAPLLNYQQLALADQVYLRITGEKVRDNV